MSDTDPVTRRVIGGAFNAIATEMAHVLYRMSNSSIIRESEDIGCSIFDAVGQELCESESSSMHIGSIPAYIRAFSATLEDQIGDGDVIIHNHPYHGASHTPDLCVALPIFDNGSLLGFAACTAHLIDTGAAVPGLYVDLVHVFAEGTLYDSVKLFEGGRRNDQVWKIMQDSVRTPEMNAADIEAMIAAVRLERERFQSLMGRYGVAAVLSAAAYWMDYSERRLRAEIARIPDGDDSAESWLDDDGRNWGTRLKFAVTVRKRNSELTIDLTGSADEARTAYNVPFEGSLKVACYYVIRTLLLDEVRTAEFIPQNQGMFRPVSVVAPKGSIFKHFTVPPYTLIEQRDPMIHAILNSKDVLGGIGTVIVTYTTTRFHDANPHLVTAYQAALQEATQFIHDHPRRTAEIYRQMTHDPLSVDELEAMVRDPDINYQATPTKIMMFADFMARLGSLHKWPAGWRDLLLQKCEACLWIKCFKYGGQILGEFFAYDAGGQFHIGRSWITRRRGKGRLTAGLPTSLTVIAIPVSMKCGVVATGRRIISPTRKSTPPALSVRILARPRDVRRNRSCFQGLLHRTNESACYGDRLVKCPRV